ncbi:MAG: ABC transporter ATP-binding protein [Burkholderiaceae bacterium]
MLSLNAVSMRFGGVLAVDQLSIGLKQGAITGLIGPNGAGKTTAFNILAGSLVPSAGQVLFEGADITALPPHRRAALGIARTFQLAHEFTRLTVVENLMVSADLHAGERVLNTLFRRGIYRETERAIFERAYELLDFLGLQALAGQPAGSLSGGQKKLLELGRALMREPRVVLLDEIGAGINRTLLGHIADMLLRLRAERGITFCLIEHDLDYVSRLCDEVFVMAGGQLLAHGSVAEVRADERVVEAYFGGGKYEDAALRSQPKAVT